MSRNSGHEDNLEPSLPDEVELYLEQSQRLAQILKQKNEGEAFTETPQGRKKNYWRGFIVGRVETFPDRANKEYLAVYPLDPAEVSATLPLDPETNVRIELHHPEVVYDNHNPGQLQGQPIPKRWDILLAKRKGAEVGQRVSLQILEPDSQK